MQGQTPIKKVFWMHLVKLGIFGAVHSGKSTIAEFYTELTKRDDKGNLPQYVPTVGLRILESEKKLTDESGSQMDVSLQIWDTSGDPAYEFAYNRIAEQLDGLIIVVPSTELNIDKYVRRYYDLITPNTKFSGGTGIGFILVFIHYNDKIAGRDVFLEDRMLATIPVVKTSMDVETSRISLAIDDFVHKCHLAKVSADNDLLVLS